MASVSSLFQHSDFGLLWLRLSVGGYLAYAGLLKFLGGSVMLRGTGTAISVLRLPAGEDSVFPMIFGVLAAATELFGGLLLVIGFFHRLAAVALLGVMVVATLLMYQVSQGNLAQFGFPMFVGFVLFGLLFTGPGRFSVQKD